MARSKKPVHKIAVIMGDGIGQEVVPEGMRVVDAAGERFGFEMRWEQFPWGCQHYLSTGEMMPTDALETLKKYDAIFLGAVGDPRVPEEVPVGGLLLKIRKGFRQYVNLRPIKLMRGMQSPLRDAAPGKIDFAVVRENNEGEYSTIGGLIYEGTEQETAIQESIFTRAGTERVIRFAFELAEKRPKKHVTSATKSNALVHSMTFWDRIFKSISREYPSIRADQVHVDAFCAMLVLRPERYDVIVASNLFGDILSDLGAAVAGSIGIAPAANLNPEREFPSMFEPVHGSAPDIAGKGIANPVGTILSGAMMLDYMGHPEAARAVESAVEEGFAGKKALTQDLGGKASTQEAGAVITKIVKAGS
jgi:tartrate dehydrogenase/decarboxylase / D-malate dehydrogenase